MLLPLVIFLALLTIGPIIKTFICSVTVPQGGGLTLDLLRRSFADPGFRQALVNTLVIAGISLSIEIAAGLALALALARSAVSLRLVRALFILPLAVPTVVVGVMMSHVFSRTGWLNRLLMDTGLLDAPVYWMGGDLQSLVMVALADCWKVTPLVMLILLAGLESIDPALYRAARVDGAGAWYTFRRITLPLLAPSLTAAIIIRGVDAFRIFALPLILMGQNLKVAGTYAYAEFVQYNNVHLSAASAAVLFAMIVGALGFYIAATGRKGIAAW